MTFKVGDKVQWMGDPDRIGLVIGFYDDYSAYYIRIKAKGRRKAYKFWAKPEDLSLIYIVEGFEI